MQIGYFTVTRQLFTLMRVLIVITAEFLDHSNLGGRRRCQMARFCPYYALKYSVLSHDA